MIAHPDIHSTTELGELPLIPLILCQVPGPPTAIHPATRRLDHIRLVKVIYHWSHDTNPWIAFANLYKPGKAIRRQYGVFI
jgi:hypothetical protein